MRRVLRYVGLWDPDRDDGALLDACAAALEGAGAPVRRLAADGGLIARYRPLAPRGELLVRPARRDTGTGGGLVWFAVDVDQVAAAGPGGWAALRDALVRLAGEVRPLMMACPLDRAVDRLPAPSAAEAADYLRTAWANLDRLPAWSEPLTNLGLPAAGGRWWSDDPLLSGEAAPIPDAEALARHLHATWPT